MALSPLIVYTSIVVFCLFGYPGSIAVSEPAQESDAVPVVPEPLCGDKVCQPGEICQQLSVLCAADSVCEAPPPECVPGPIEVIVRPRPIRSCAEIKCEDGYTCQLQEVQSPAPGIFCPKRPCPLIARCIPINPCANKRCKKGYRCQVENVVCVRAPCPPIASCVPIDPCTFTSCPEGLLCSQSENDPTIAECGLTPCATVKCANGTECQASVEFCTAAPCPKPSASCVPTLEDNPCALVDCRSGYICRNVPVTDCDAPPCPKFRPVCENPCEGNPCPDGSQCYLNEHGAALCPPPISCADIVCEKDKECQVITNPCFVPPCPTESVCVCKNT